MPLPISDEVLAQIYEVSDWVARHKFSNPLVQHHIVEALLKLIDQSLEVSSDQPFKLKYIVAHDTTLMGLLSYLDSQSLIDVYPPNFSSFIVFELWESESPLSIHLNEEGPFRYVQVFYDNQKLRINGSKSKMSHTNFKRLMTIGENLYEGSDF